MKEGEDEMSENRREFFRVMFNQAMNGKVSIYGGEFLPIEIYNVSAGGLVFFFRSQYSVGGTCELQFRTTGQRFFIGWINRPKINRKRHDRVWG